MMEKLFDSCATWLGNLAAWRTYKSHIMQLLLQSGHVPRKSSRHPVNQTQARVLFFCFVFLWGFFLCFLVEKVKKDKPFLGGWGGVGRFRRSRGWKYNVDDVY